MIDYTPVEDWNLVAICGIESTHNVVDLNLFFPLTLRLNEYLFKEKMKLHISVLM